MLTEESLLEIIKKGNYIEADCLNCKKSGYYFYPEGSKVVTLGEEVSISKIKHDSCVIYFMNCCVHVAQALLLREILMTPSRALHAKNHIR